MGGGQDSRLAAPRLAFTSAPRRRGFGLPWWAWILALTTVEALAVIVLLPTRWVRAVGRGDGAEYQRYAFNMLHHGVFSEVPAGALHPGVVRSPGYPFFLMIFEGLFGRHAAVIQAAQFGLLAATAILVGLIGRALIGPAVGNLAAVLCVVYLPFVDFASVFLTETLTTTLLAAAMLLLVRARRSGTVRAYAGVGVALAAASYVRPECSLIAVPIAAVLALERRPASYAVRGSAAAALLAALVIPLVPWLIRDASVTGGTLIPMEADGGVALLASADQYNGAMSQGFADVAYWNRQVARITGVGRAATVGIQAPVEFADARRQVAINKEEQSAAIRLFKSLPASALGRLPKRVVALWSVADETPPPAAGSLWHRASQLEYVLLLVASLIGALLRRRSWRSDWPLWLVAVTLTATHIVFPVEARYTVPARAMLMVYASVGALAAWSWLRRWSSSRTGASAGPQAATRATSR